MLIRLLIYLVIGALIYRTAKNWFGSGSRHEKVQGGGNTPIRADDVMIQDPQCGVYFAKRDGVSLIDGNQELHFCSEKCKESYLAQRKNSR